MTNSGSESPRGWSLTAGALTQLLAAVACFLGAFVLPYTTQEFRGVSRVVLILLGVGMLVLGIGNVLLGRQLSRLLVRAGKRSRVVVPREGIGYLAIMLTLAVGALLGHRNMPLLVFGMMAGPFILNGWIVYGMLKSVSVRRNVADRASVGEVVLVEVRVANAKKLLASHLLEVRDQISGPGTTKKNRDVEGIVTFVRVPPRQHRAGRYQVRFAERGRYRFGPARISSRFPLGIGERGQLLSDTSDVIVHPEVGRLLPAWQKLQKELAESSHRVWSRPGLFDDEFHRIREYRDDDNPRSIHWRSTARHGELMIREYQQNRQASSLVLLDLPQLSSWKAAETETAISLAATICVEQSRAASGSHYLLGIAAADVQIITSRVPGGFREQALDALAVCQPSGNADLQSLLLAVLDTCSLAGERLILITPRPQQARHAVDAASAQLASERLDLAAHTSIVEASAPAMEQVFSLHGSSPTFGTAGSVSAAGKAGERSAR
ncbi:MAG: DUF58 domain-containing protein [Fuerstiella sp.]